MEAPWSGLTEHFVQAHKGQRGVIKEREVSLEMFRNVYKCVDFTLST